MKKRTISFLMLSAILMVTLSACGGKTDNDAGNKGELKGKKMDKKQSDVVSERTEEIDGQKFTIKTFADGTEVTLPEGVDMDDVDVQGFD